MDIYSRRGSKVIFDRPDKGPASDSETARKHLVVGETYTVAFTHIGDSGTDVYLQEVEGVHFNSLLFSDAE